MSGLALCGAQTLRSPLQRLRHSALGQIGGQAVEPCLVVVLQRHQLGHGVAPTLRAAASVAWPPVADLGRLGAVAEFEKATLVAKLAAARRRKRTATGRKVEGRKSHAEQRPEVVALAKALARKKPKGGRLSLRAVAAAMAAQGHLNERGRPYNPKSIATMLAA